MADSADEAGQIAPGNEIVNVEALAPLFYDGDPEIEGSEFYVPAGWNMADYCEAQGVDAPLLDGNGDVVQPQNGPFSMTLIEAEALAGRGLVRILA